MSFGSRISTRLASVIALFTLSSLVLSACGGASPSSSSAAGAQGGNLTIVVADDAWTNFDPFSSANAQPIALLDPVYDPLFYPSSSGAYTPDLATGYQVSADKTTFTISLRHGVKFQDGTPFNAAAVVFDLKRYADPAVKSPCVGQLSVMKSVTATGPYTVTVQLSAPDALFIPLLATTNCALMPSPTAVQKEGASFGLHPVGTGAFKYTGGTMGVTANFAAFEGYWRGKPHLSSITLNNVSSSTAALNSVVSGSAQMWTEILDPGDATQLQQAQQNSSLQVLNQQGTQTIQVLESFSHAPFNNLVARQALAYATDAPGISKSLFSGVFPAVQGILPPAALGYSSTVPGYPAYNLAKAKQLVQQLGGLSFTLTTRNTPSSILLADALQAEWAKAGIKVKVSPVDEVTGTTIFYSHSYDAFVGPLHPSNDPAAVVNLAFDSGSTTNVDGLNNAGVDKLINQGTAVYDPAQRKPIYQQLNQLISGDLASTVGLVVLTNYSVESKKVTNLPTNAFFLFNWWAAQLGG